MRIRQVKPGFWTDVVVTALPAPCRLFYIGLWMQADDSGWFRWDVPQIAAELYGFEPRGRRERNVVAFGDALEAAGRLKRIDCGHAYIATLERHQRLSGNTKQVHTFKREHDSTCMTRIPPRVPADTRTSPPGKERNGRGQVSEGKEQVASARSPEGDALATEFEVGIAANGGAPWRRPRVVQ